MHFTNTIVIFMWLLSWTAAFKFPQEVPNYSDKVCRPQLNCTGADINAFGTKNKYLEMSQNCLCEDSCGIYGDCCADRVHSERGRRPRPGARYSCVEIEDGTGMYVTARCPAAWRDLRVRDACETPGDISRNGMLNNPVTSRSTGLAYRNRFCAVCNGDTADLAMWDTRLDCENLTEVSESSRLAVLDTLRYDDGNWTVEYENVTFGCQFTIIPPRLIGVRPCLPETVTTCHSEWPDDQIRARCENSTKRITYNEGRLYKNIDCALCNRVPEKNLTCEKTEIHIKFYDPFAPRSFTSLLLAQPNHRKCSNRLMFYDFLMKTCRPVSSAGDAVPLLNCSQLIVYDVVSKGWQPTGDVEYVTLDNGSVALCANTTAATGRDASADEAFNSTVLTYVGLSVSAVFLVVHLIVFSVLPDPKNLSGKNLASLCVSLLCSYSAFVAGNWLTGTPCYVGAALTCYTFLASFTWMLVMSYDCWRSLRLATVKLRMTSGPQTKKFLVYSAVCWLVPAVITCTAVAADLIPAMPDAVRPRFGADQCWFGNRTALMMFFVGPLAGIMSINLVLFACTASMICWSRATVNTEHVRRNSRMYFRMVVLMGLTWTAGVLASYANNKYLWILFVALNTFQGLFVFLAFTCRRRIFRSLFGDNHGHNVDHGHRPHTENDNNNKNARPVPFYVSTNDDSVTLSSERTSDTYY